MSLKSLFAATLACLSIGALAQEVTVFEDPPSARTRAEVVAELLRARASGELDALRGPGEASAFPEAVAGARAAAHARVSQRAASATRR